MSINFCNICDYHFSTKYNFNRHNDRYHSMEFYGSILMSIQNDKTQRLLDVIYNQVTQIIGNFFDDIHLILEKELNGKSRLFINLNGDDLKYLITSQYNSNTSVINFQTYMTNEKLANKHYQCIMTNGKFLGITTIFQRNIEGILHQAENVITSEICTKTLPIYLSANFQIYHRENNILWDFNNKITLFIYKNLPNYITVITDAYKIDKSMIIIIKTPEEIKLINDKIIIIYQLTKNFLESKAFYELILIKKQTVIIGYDVDKINLLPYTLIKRVNYVLTNTKPALEYYYYFKFSNCKIPGVNLLVNTALKD